jgi:IstB-like ATP binding protein
MGFRELDFWEICDERRALSNSTILTSQVPVARWHEQIGDATIADGVLDRLVHDAHRIELRGQSMREAKTRKPEAKSETGTASREGFSRLKGRPLPCNPILVETKTTDLVRRSEEPASFRFALEDSCPVRADEADHFRDNQHASVGALQSRDRNHRNADPFPKES